MLLNCTCFRVRRLSRQITQIYDEALRPIGLRITQFSLLSALRNEGPMSVATLAKGLGADTTSISRALATVSAHGWVLVGDGEDGRSKSVSITAEGLARLLEAEPYWHSAQGRVAKMIGADGQKYLDAQLEELAQKLSTE